MIGVHIPCSDRQLLVSMILPDLRGGGAERVAVNLANAFVCRGYVVDMGSLSATGQFLSELLPEVRVVDLIVGRVRWAIFPLVRYLRSVQPAVVLACISPLTVIALWVAVLAGVCMLANEKYMNRMVCNA